MAQHGAGDQPHCAGQSVSANPCTHSSCTATKLTTTAFRLILSSCSVRDRTGAGSHKLENKRLCLHQGLGQEEFLGNIIQSHTRPGLTVLHSAPQSPGSSNCACLARDHRHFVEAGEAEGFVSDRWCSASVWVTTDNSINYQSKPASPLIPARTWWLRVRQQAGVDQSW